MATLIRNHGGKMFLAGFVAGLLTLGVMAFSGTKPSDRPPREVVLLGRSIAFYLPDQPDKPNPTLTFKKGEPVRLIIRNDEPGRVLHCFTITGLNVKTSSDLAAGQTETLSFTPKQKGTFAYACLLHPSMTGKLVVE
jgi:heme/copper-type cytochrome/quinol oxidase subunit 2